MTDVLIVGATGGREAALEQAIKLSKNVNKAVVFKDLKEGLKQFSDSKNKPFVIIGPEQSLVDGLADDLRSQGYKVFGVSAKAAQYEASKAATVQLAIRAGVTHPNTYIAKGANFAKNALKYVQDHNANSYVIKADGLAAGKGVYLPDTKQEALEIVNGLIDGSYAGGAGAKVINFAMRRRGPEVSAMVVVGQSPEDYVILPLSQDHKRAKDKDKGPNTGGMGAYAPVPSSIVSAGQYKKIDDMAAKLLAQMHKDGIEYKGGVMYLGLMMDEKLGGDPTLIEINVRFGDPETQVILPLLNYAGVDVYELLYIAATKGGIKSYMNNYGAIKNYAAITVCLAANGYGYTDTPQKGDVIYGLNNKYSGVTVQMASVTNSGDIKTNGGRVLYVSAAAKSVKDAANIVYKAIGDKPDGKKIFFNDMQYRHDIGWQAR
ncbi:hypothetical protein KBC85_02055 [Candidatus Saccharibacteria bacterium]|nr:hypothetical protein [Candidatus Saccharibacteria bacterium]